VTSKRAHVWCVCVCGSERDRAVVAMVGRELMYARVLLWQIVEESREKGAKKNAKSNVRACPQGWRQMSSCGTHHENYWC
jgi:hypothetical protein